MSFQGLPHRDKNNEPPKIGQNSLNTPFIPPNLPLQKTPVNKNKHLPTANYSNQKSSNHVLPNIKHINQFQHADLNINQFQRPTLQTSTVRQFKLAQNHPHLSNRSNPIIHIANIPQIQRINNRLTASDKVMTIDRNSQSRHPTFIEQVVEQEIIEHSPTYDHNIQNNQRLDANGWEIVDDQNQLPYQQNIYTGQYQNQHNLRYTEEAVSDFPQGGMGDMFGQMIAQGANNQFNPFGAPPFGEPPFGGVPLPHLGLNPGFNNFSGTTQFDQNINAGNFMGNSINHQNPMGSQIPSQRNMRGSQNSIPDSLHFSQSSQMNTNPQFNGFQNPFGGMQQGMQQGFVSVQNHQIPVSQPSFFQGGSSAPMAPQLGVSPQMMQLGGAMASLFHHQQNPFSSSQQNSMNVSQTRPLMRQNDGFGPGNPMNQNMAQIFQQQIQQGNNQPPPPLEYFYIGPQPELITCVICKQTYDVNNTKQHVLKHKSLKGPAKNQILKAALIGTATKSRAVIAKPPIIHPIVQPQQCTLSPQGNTYVIERIHRLEGQPVQIIDDYPGRFDDVQVPIQAGPFTSRMPSNDMMITQTHVFDAPYEQRFSQQNYRNSQGAPGTLNYIQEEQFQSNQYMMGSQIRNSNIAGSQMRNSNMMGSQMRPQHSSEVSDFSYNHMGDMIPEHPRTGVIASQKMRIPRQVLSAWHGL